MVPHVCVQRGRKRKGYREILILQRRGESGRKKRKEICDKSLLLLPPFPFFPVRIAKKKFEYGKLLCFQVTAYDLNSGRK